MKTFGVYACFTGSPIYTGRTDKGIAIASGKFPGVIARIPIGSCDPDIVSSYYTFINPPRNDNEPQPVRP